MSVFVSWTGSDREIKDKLVEGLQAELGPDELVWESDKNCMSDFSSDCIEAIRACSVFVIIISDAAMSETSFVFNELCEARKREMRGELNIVVYKITDSEYTNRFELQLNHISDANHAARLMKNESGIQNVAKRVKYLLARRRSGNPEKPYDVYQPEIEGIKLGNTGYFVPSSRDDVFDAFDKGFERSNVIFATQISGYGRKSAARKYAQLHMEDYKKVLVLHFFSGSLREFFTNGLVISNINENVFENLDENKTILKKVNLLKKLDQKTLIIVPNVTIGKRDDTFIFDALSELGCRVIFIAQNVPPRMKDTFPVIDVGRLKNRHLREMFFNYYTEADECEQEKLEEPLDRFFERIDGHTKSVEITATALADEIGVYPEDLPEILENIQLNSENELSERIFQLISSMFDERAFEEAEKNILLLASLAADVPMDEKLFVSLSKACGVADNTAIKNLAECRWLERDKASKTISIEPLLASVCLAKMSFHEQIVERCIRFLTDMLSEECIAYTFASSVVTVKRLRHIFKVLKMPALCELMELYVLAIDDVLIEYERSYSQKRIDNARLEADQISSQGLKDVVNEMLEYVIGIVQGQLRLFDLSHRVGTKTLGEEAVKISVMNEETLASIEASLDDMEENAFTRSVRRLLNSARFSDSGKFVTEYLQMVEELEECLMTEPTEEELSVLAMLEFIGQGMALVTKAEPYLSLELSRAREKLLDYSGGFISMAEAYFFYENYLGCLVKMSDCTEELDTVFSLCICALEEGKKEIWKTEKEAAISKNQIICYYAECLADNGRTEDAEEAYSMTEEIEMIEPVIVKTRMETLDCIARAMIKAGEIQASMDFLEEYLDSFEQILMSNESLFTEERYLFSELKEILNILRSPKTDSGFEDSSAEYIDYYRTYASGFMDKRLSAKYGAIAEQAKQLDFSAKSREELQQEILQLKKKALHEPRWEKLAPLAFALVSEAGERILGYKHHYVQYMGGAAIADGKIAELLNGEGKTYTIILAAFLQSLYGKQIYIIDSSTYLTKRNFVWMRGVLEYLGCKVGLIAKCPKTVEELDELKQCDIIYAMINELIYLQMRDEMNRCHAQLRFDLAIIDEADQLMIEEADQNISITEKEERSNSRQAYELANLIVRDMTIRDTELFERKNGVITLKSAIYEKMNRYLNISYLQLPTNMRNDVEKALKVAIKVYLYYQKGRDYYIIGGKAMAENKDKGVLYDMNSVYQFFIGKKEGIPELYMKTDFTSYRTVNKYIYMEFLFNFKEICGTTATASSMKEEFKKLYGIDVISIPPNQPIVRVDYKSKVYIKEIYKLRDIAQLVCEKHQTGQPVIVITGSIEESEKISRLLKENGVEHRLLNAKNSEDEPEMLGSAGRIDSVIVTTAMANRGVDILLGGNPKELAKKHLLESGISAGLLNQAIYGALETSDEVAEIRSKYESLVALYKNKTDAEKRKAETVGGLCVIGTECFEDLRTEQQMRGRAGRQGAIGESHVFYSLDDDPINFLLGERKEMLTTLLDGIEDEALESSMLNKSLVNGRLRIQEANFRHLQRTPELLYYRKARKQILGLIDKLRKEQITALQLVEDYFINNERVIKKLTSGTSGQRTYTDPRARKFLSYVDGDLLAMKPRMASEALRKAYLSSQAYLSEISKKQNSSESFIKTFLTGYLCVSWREYLKQMPIEMKNANDLFGNKEKKVEKYMSEYSEAQCRILIEDAVYNAVIHAVVVKEKNNQ